MSRSAVAVAVLLSSAGTLTAAHLYPQTVTAWEAYVGATEQRIAAEAHRPVPSGVLNGDVLVEPMRTLNGHGDPMAVPSALVQHWRGAVYIPRITVTWLVTRLQDDTPPQQEDVRSWRVLERRPDWMRVSLTLQRSSLITVVYHTEHLVTFVRDGASGATSASRATRIVEVADANTPREHELPAGDDRGFLWRLNAYWRYQQAGDGVVAECESITLSRDVPPVVKFVVMPLVERAARESMMRTLVALRTRFSTA